MIETIATILAGAAGGAAGTVAQLVFGSDELATDDESQEGDINGQAVEVIEQVGDQVSEPEDFAYIIDGLSISYNENNSTKRYTWSEPSGDHTYVDDSEEL